MDWNAITLWYDSNASIITLVIGALGALGTLWRIRATRRAQATSRRLETKLDQLRTELREIIVVKNPILQRTRFKSFLRRLVYMDDDPEFLMPSDKEIEVGLQSLVHLSDISSKPPASDKSSTA